MCRSRAGIGHWTVPNGTTSLFSTQAGAFSGSGSSSSEPVPWVAVIGGYLNESFVSGPSPSGEMVSSSGCTQCLGAPSRAPGPESMPAAPMLQSLQGWSSLEDESLAHMPPEVLLDGCATSASDVYSFGIVLWEMVTQQASGLLPPLSLAQWSFPAGTRRNEWKCLTAAAPLPWPQVPFKGYGPHDLRVAVIKENMRPLFPAYTPEEYVRLATQCWAADPAVRPSFSETTLRLQGLLSKLLLDPKRASLRGVGSAPASGANPVPRVPEYYSAVVAAA